MSRCVHFILKATKSRTHDRANSSAGQATWRQAEQRQAVTSILYETDWRGNLSKSPKHRAAWEN